MTTVGVMIGPGNAVVCISRRGQMQIYHGIVAREPGHVAGDGHHLVDFQPNSPASDLVGGIAVPEPIAISNGAD